WIISTCIHNLARLWVFFNQCIHSFYLFNCFFFCPFTFIKRFCHSCRQCSSHFYTFYSVLYIIYFFTYAIWVPHVILHFFSYTFSVFTHSCHPPLFVLILPLFVLAFLLIL